MVRCVSLNKIEFYLIMEVVFLMHARACVAKTSSNFASKNKVQIESIHGYQLKNITEQLAVEFDRISNEELGVSVIQTMFKKLKYTIAIPDVDKIVRKMAAKLEEKLNETFSMLYKIRDRIKMHEPYSPHSTISPCNSNSDEQLDVSAASNYSFTEPTFTVDEVLSKQRLSAKKLKGAIKRLYLLSTQDVSACVYSPITNCDKQDQASLWKLYMEHRNSSSRNVMLLLDHGGSLSRQQFRIVKAVAKQILATLNKQDKVGLLAVSDEWTSPYLTDHCLLPNQIPSVSDSHVMSPATEHNKYLINRFIDSLTKGNGVTNHSLGFQQAIQTIKASNISVNETILLLYVSRGLLSSLTEAKTVLETISGMLEEVDNSVIIGTCVVIDDSKPVMYETHFLRDIAEQNYFKYNVSSVYNVQKGMMLTVNSTQAIGLAVTRFYKVFGYFDSIHLEPKISLPTWDSVAEDLSISVTVPYKINGDMSLLGLDLYFASLTEDVTYYSNYQYYTYAFIINTEGIVIMHPSYPRPSSVKEQLKYVDISHVEKHSNFQDIRIALLTKMEGSYLLQANDTSLRYLWRRIGNWYVVCLVLNENEAPPLRPHKVAWFPATGNSGLVHHRLDLLPVKSVCRHLNQVATLDAGSLYLSAACFQSPYLHLHNSKDEKNQLNIQSYMAYLKDNTRLLANPGLKDEIRDDVVALAHILEFLRIQHLTGARARYIVRRYVTSPSGVLQVFPGGFISPGIEPTRRSWYLKAVEHKFRSILTPPYLDAGGAGYIVTVAYATSQLVTAMDVTFGYIYKLLLKRMPFCTQKNVKCFMMDDRGYLIYHPNLIDPNGHGPIEQQHIIHKESLVANDILNHQNFVKKMLCNDYADQTIQRYYRLNTSLTDVLVNAVHGEHCVKYQVSAVPGTNIFVGVVNATCEVVATFCPCSMVDRLCLNCNRMEQKECECPCECPLNLDTCTHPNRTFMNNPVCSTLPEQHVPIQPTVKQEELRSCIPTVCETQQTYESCLGVLGCEWCQFDVDGESLLANPFCTSFSTCFNGILGSVTPYGDAVGGASVSEDLSSSYSPLGPILGSVVGVCLVLGILFFCYRSYSSSAVERFYLTAAQDNRVRMSDFNMSDDFQECDSHQDKLLQDTKKMEPISPYCVSTGYRRPPTAADSDHGYSTMTPHDESEHLSFAPVEIDSLEDDCTSDATSINTSVSSKQPKGNDQRNKMRTIPQLTDLQLTSLPNRIIAPVTVHRNMEMTQ